MLPRRTYWNGFSGGGQMGWAQIMNYPEEYDGALIGSALAVLGEAPSG
jgi:predicted peptidase